MVSVILAQRHKRQHLSILVGMKVVLESCIT